MTDDTAAMTPEAFSRWIKDHGYTQESLATTLRINRTSLYKWIRGNHPVTVRVKLALDMLGSGKHIDADPDVEMTGPELAAWMREYVFDDAMLGDVLGLHPLSVARWRTGRHPIDYPTRLALERIAQDTRGLEARRQIAEVKSAAREDADERAAQKVQAARERALRTTKRSVRVV